VVGQQTKAKENVVKNCVCTSSDFEWLAPVVHFIPRGYEQDTDEMPIANLITCEMQKITAYSSKARSHCRTTTRAVVARSTGMSVHPTDASHIRLVKMANGQIVAADISALAWPLTERSSGSS
jgi:hypothetical protein